MQTFQTNEELLETIAMFEKKVNSLAKAGPGAGMATAANNSYLRKLKAEAEERGIDLAVASVPAAPKGASKSNPVAPAPKAKRAKAIVTYARK